jgi:hypothetical protein
MMTGEYEGEAKATAGHIGLKTLGLDGVIGNLPYGPARYKICSLYYNAMMRT